MFKKASILALALVGSSTAWAGITVNGSTPEVETWRGMTYYKLPLAPQNPVGPRVRVTDEGITTQAVGDQGACTPDEFITMTSASPVGASLVNRHKLCQKYRSTPTLVTVDLMRLSPGANWEWYRPGVQYYDVGTFDVGTVVVETSMQAYGASNALKKTFKIDAQAVSFSPSPGFPAYLLGSAKLNLTPVPGVFINADSSAIQNFNIGVNGTIRQITLPGDPIQQSTGAFDVTFSWNFSGSDPQTNYASIRAIVPKYYYAVNNTPRRLATEPQSFDATSSANAPDAPYLRCDKRVASAAIGFAEGCVFNEAAPIMEISKSGAGAEAAIHIELAQTSRDSYKTQLSPGVFFATQGTRAIPWEYAEQTVGLIRGTPPDDEMNRTAACENTNPNSLVRTRPFSGSASCQAPQPSSTCSCDEYPFAMTKNGGAYNPQGTSVRYIPKTHNSSSSGQMTNTFNSQRVFRGEKFWVRVIP